MFYANSLKKKALSPKIVVHNNYNLLTKKGESTMRPGRYDSLDFEKSKQNLSFMLREAESDFWGFMRENQRKGFK